MSNPDPDPDETLEPSGEDEEIPLGPGPARAPPRSISERHLKTVIESLVFVAEKPMLKALPPHGYDCATIDSASVDRQFRVRVDGNRYSVPAAYAGRKLLLKLYPERLCLYDGEKLLTEHLRSYERNRDFENPEHARPVLERKRRADEQHLLKRFLALSPQAESYYRQLAERKLSWRLHLRKIVALVDVYGAEKVAHALADALVYHAFSSDYIANILEQRERRLPEPGPLHLARKQDLLDLELPDPDLSVYGTDEEQPAEGDPADEAEA